MIWARVMVESSDGHASSFTDVEVDFEASDVWLTIFALDRGQAWAFPARNVRQVWLEQEPTIIDETMSPGHQRWAQR